MYVSTLLRFLLVWLLRFLLVWLLRFLLVWLLRFLLVWLLQVKLLKDILEAWKAEVEKKPPTMSLEEAYTVLKLPKGANG